jgi:tRNA pseudouridine synthase 10
LAGRLLLCHCFSLPCRHLQHAHAKAQAGTYIKEFVHGDGGRTQPNLGSFLGLSEPAEILELDVLEIHMEFL